MGEMKEEREIVSMCERRRRRRRRGECLLKANLTIWTRKRERKRKLGEGDSKGGLLFLGFERR